MTTQPPLPPESTLGQRRDAWTRALDSKEYLQGTGMLRSPDNRFCCLGVACDIYRKAHPESKWVDSGHKSFIFQPDPKIEGSSAFMPDEVTEWFGLATSNGGFKEPIISSLTNMNDGGRSFKEIAAIIRNKPDGLFKHT